MVCLTRCQSEECPGQSVQHCCDPGVLVLSSVIVAFADDAETRQDRVFCGPSSSTVGLSAGMCQIKSIIIITITTTTIIIMITQRPPAKLCIPRQFLSSLIFF